MCARVHKRLFASALVYTVNTFDLGAPIQMRYETWTVNEIRDGETVEVTKGATHDEAVLAIRRAMYGESDAFAAPTEVHELPLAA
jgi:hypothetical protein